LSGQRARTFTKERMDIDELSDAFILAFDEWCSDEEYGMGGPKFDAMLEARSKLELARARYNEDRGFQIFDSTTIPF
jgi:hypothetical protein